MPSPELNLSPCLTLLLFSSVVQGSTWWQDGSQEVPAAPFSYVPVRHSSESPDPDTHWSEDGQMPILGLVTWPGDGIY